MKLPKHLKQYFWNVNFDTLDSERDHYTIIMHILEYGEEEAVRWMFKTYPRERIIDIVKTSRDFIYQKNLHFWTWYFKLEDRGIRCPKKQYIPPQMPIWLY